MATVTHRDAGIIFGQCVNLAAASIKQFDAEDIIERARELFDAYITEYTEVISDFPEDKPRSNSSSRSSGQKSSGKQTKSRRSGGGKRPSAATPKQVNFINELLESRVHDYDHDFDPSTLTSKEASDVIEELLEAEEVPF